jgi:hypothetical protein
MIRWPYKRLALEDEELYICSGNALRTSGISSAVETTPARIVPTATVGDDLPTGDPNIL